MPRSLENAVDVGLVVGIVWILGQILLVLGALYVVVRLAVGRALKAHCRRETSTAEGVLSQN
jgi:hypothetical protein